MFTAIDGSVLDRIYKNIVPRILPDIHKLIVDQYSVKRILQTTSFPQLNSLSLVNFESTKILRILKSNGLHCILTHQITNLDVDIQPHRKEDLEIRSEIFNTILSICKRLINLNFCQLYRYRYLSTIIDCYPRKGCISSTLTKLKISVESLEDYLTVLNGDLYCLSTLIINIKHIRYSLSESGTLPILPSLKCFSLFSLESTYYYDREVIPLLHRMINLEELTLFLYAVRWQSTFIDGVQLQDQIIMRLPQLNKFTFSIYTTDCCYNKDVNFEFQPNKDLGRSFTHKIFRQVASYVHINRLGTGGDSHVYSLPYEFEDFIHLNNSFPGGMFNKVVRLKMLDAFPFEHTLFKTVSDSFPQLKHLIIWNDKPQERKHCSSVLNVFPHLILLDLLGAHMSYAEELLYNTNSILPRLHDLHIQYESLRMITNNFTIDVACLNCNKLRKLNLNEVTVLPENFHQYFPLI
ncbi:unnamed protein product [Adineta ricciae]|uniref:Uncharacterized protein n=1 Tax=Adineta ricciae TaxID=249248 RepID=A0A814Z1M5_ADIRI|nr:unnamed protein product [Adineta ricciae]